MPKLGEILVKHGVLSPRQRDEAVEQQRPYSLGRYLLSKGLCNPLQCYQALATQRGLSFVNLLKNLPDKNLLHSDKIEEYLHLQLLPYTKLADGTVLIAGIDFNEEQQRWAQQHFPRHQFVQTAPRDIHTSLSRLFPQELSHQSIYGLALSSPLASARTLWQRHQHLPVLLVLLLCCGFMLYYPEHFLAGFMIAVCIFHALTLGFKALLFTIGRFKRQIIWHAHHNKPDLSDGALPSYTILVPLYQEAAVLPQLVEAIRALDYPKPLLEVKLLIEADDAETYRAACELNLEGFFEILQVPTSQPRTKPKACNYALRFATGDIVTIYDAEDIPAPNQLRQVAKRFHYGARDLVCVQCRLNYYNRQSNLLTRLFSIEYGAWFDFMLPALSYLRLPIPLGGTSNHIHRKTLMAMGEWDPFNVTEDADLGIRLAALRYRTEVADSLTMEECPMHLWAWLKQRSRWIKGYMQTWLVYMRRPIWLWRQLGGKGFWAFQLFVGGPCLVFLSTPLLLSISLTWWWHPALFSFETTQLLWPLCLTTLLLGIVLHFLFAVETVRDRRWQGMILAMLCFPFYWLLHSLASFRALSQLITRPHYWEKTEHGFWDKTPTKNPPCNSEES